MNKDWRNRIIILVVTLVLGLAFFLWGVLAPKNDDDKSQQPGTLNVCADYQPAGDLISDNSFTN